MRGFESSKTRQFSGKVDPLENEGNRARRFPLQAHVEVADVQAATQIQERTTDLSLFGCQVKTVTPFTPATKVSVKISHAGESFRALGRVAYARPGVGMGIVFTTIQSSDRMVLEEWLAELRSKS